MGGKPRKRQTEIPGTERQSIPEIDDKAVDYVGDMYARRELQSTEKQKKQALISEMKARKVAAYKYVDGEFEYTISLKTEQVDKLSIKRSKVDDGEPEGGDVIDFEQAKAKASADELVDDNPEPDGDPDWLGEPEQ